ncbi:MAG: nucleoside diphosphate kinase regulator [Candidatus Omnitrophica bacterium]|nr:nucleoside diphosphate kinase regulator [Candidatus Omnitrophota bacterium]
MNNKKIYMTKSDYDRLREIITNMAGGRDIDRRSLDELEHSCGSRDELDLVKEIRKIRTLKNEAEWARIEDLASELDRAIIVEVDKMPDDVVTVNSKICLRDMDAGEDEIYEVVYPEDADIEQNKISVLAPIGTAVLGYKVGDIIEWKVPAGIRRLKIKKILYQPEASQNQHI